MDDLDQRLLDSVKLINDAHREGQLAALRKVRNLLGERLRQVNAVIVTSAQPAGKVKARGAHEAIERIVGELDVYIAAIESERAAE